MANISQAEPNDSGKRVAFPEHPQLSGMDTGQMDGRVMTASSHPGVPPEAPSQAGVGSMSNITNMGPGGSSISTKGRESFSPLVNRNPLGK